MLGEVMHIGDLVRMKRDDPEDSYYENAMRGLSAVYQGVGVVVNIRSDSRHSPIEVLWPDGRIQRHSLFWMEKVEGAPPSRTTGNRGPGLEP